MSNGPHILLVDDDFDMHDVVRVMLAPTGYRVTCCPTSDCARDVLREDCPDLLLLDVMLSTPTEGLELAAEIRADPTFRGVPIIVVSTAPPDVQDEIPRAADAAIIDEFMEKPLSTRTLRATIARLLAAR